jgi:hypothetical protein
MAFGYGGFPSLDPVEAQLEILLKCNGADLWTRCVGEFHISDLMRRCPEFRSSASS